VVVDRFSKAAHFVASSHLYTVEEVAQVYLDNVLKLHGWPQSIVSDRYNIFLSAFWQALFSIQGSNLLLSSSYHLQTDGQTEIVNKCLETYLRCMCSDSPKDWSKWLPLANISGGITPPFILQPNSLYTKLCITSLHPYIYRTCQQKPR